MERIIFCSGKIYYELVNAREAAGQRNIAIVRLEQYYPYPFLPTADIIQKYESAHDVCWVQEEPRNQGAWSSVEKYIAAQLGPHQELRYLGRVASPSPATGYLKVHTREQEEIIRTAMRVTQRARKEVLHGS
ncbi:MAG: hypothetical protein HY042_13105 [Spirochaetia bacterium]|nr:hypothetical protein [Spirochaetia bacterium]